MPSCSPTPIPVHRSWVRLDALRADLEAMRDKLVEAGLCTASHMVGCALAEVAFQECQRVREEVEALMGSEPLRPDSPEPGTSA